MNLCSELSVPTSRGGQIDETSREVDDRCVRTGESSFGVPMKRLRSLQV
jgi:hypothetical protein